jgi:hypothetical protein
MNRDNANVLADETHSSLLWGCVLLLSPFGMIVSASRIPAFGVRIVLVIASLVISGAAVMALSGFHYIFTPAGLEIRTLGYRLRSIAPEQIREYSVADWNITRGYGIRGVGNRRAYVWGNKGVRIKTTDGEVFLGHSEPSRIVQDLELMKQFAH